MTNNQDPIEQARQAQQLAEAEANMLAPVAHSLATLLHAYPPTLAINASLVAAVARAKEAGVTEEQWQTVTMQLWREVQVQHEVGGS